MSDAGSRGLHTAASSARSSASCARRSSRIPTSSAAPFSPSSAFSFSSLAAARALDAPLPETTETRLAEANCRGRCWFCGCGRHPGVRQHICCQWSGDDSGAAVADHSVESPPNCLDKGLPGHCRGACADSTLKSAHGFAIERRYSFAPLPRQIRPSGTHLNVEAEPVERGSEQVVLAGELPAVLGEHERAGLSATCDSR